jgi:4-hydroxythreonine-4-phosphate dehydrogenase
MQHGPSTAPAPAPRLTPAARPAQPRRLVIVADDLTGAADSAAHLAGYAEVVLLVHADPPWPRAGVIALDTDSRHLGPAEAARRVAAAIGRSVTLGAVPFKKIDSTLRGNVAVEVRAAADACAASGPAPLVVVAPAFPAVGRTTAGGVVHVDGRPLSDAVHGGDLLRLLAAERFTPELVGRPGSAGDVVARLHAATQRGADAVVVDAETDDDLRSVAVGALAGGVPVLFVGTGGLARAFDEVVRDGSAHAPAAVPAGPALVVVGSHSPQARAQLRALVEAGVAGTAWSEAIEPGELARAIRAGLGRGAVVLSPDVAVPVDHTRAAAVAEGLATAACAALDHVTTLIATGGETARAILTRHGVAHLRVVGELEPGVVLMHVEGRDLSVVTKAGAFGDERVLVRCLPTHPHPEV